jgi:hypothetical protein
VGAAVVQRRLQPVRGEIEARRRAGIAKVKIADHLAGLRRLCRPSVCPFIGTAADHFRYIESLGDDEPITVPAPTTDTMLKLRRWQSLINA